MNIVKSSLMALGIVAISHAQITIAKPIQRSAQLKTFVEKSKSDQQQNRLRPLSVNCIDLSGTWEGTCTEIIEGRTTDTWTEVHRIEQDGCQEIAFDGQSFHAGRSANISSDMKDFYYSIAFYPDWEPNGNVLNVRAHTSFRAYNYPSYSHGVTRMKYMLRDRKLLRQEQTASESEYGGVIDTTQSATECVFTKQGE